MQGFTETDFTPIALVLALPVLGAFINGVWGRRLGKAGVRLMALSAVGLSFLASVVTVAKLAALVSEASGGEGESHGAHVRLYWQAWEWMFTNGARDVTVPIAAKFSVDALSAVMMLVVTGVGFLIHLYATSYMDTEDDAGFARFFTYLNLFIFSMLVLILGDNLPVLFVGWEGVGLCSYLLIGFWFHHAPNAAAGKKAFIANRVGDFGLLCAMFLIAHYTGALDWRGIEAGASSLVTTTEPSSVHVWPLGGGQYTGFLSFLQPKEPIVMMGATAVGLALLLGCAGKSAQIPLYVWLPDAMAGPTPVSALIHAATMVTAGIYLVCRLNFVFLLSPFAMACVATVGAATAVFAATIALVQNDIKKVLAYSTVSQLGFMFLGVGVGAFVAGFFHVFTHAFFKACLFLGAGSVIHAMHSRIHDDDKAQDIRHMGGLSKYMPITFWTFAAATAAIVGFPLTSGFFSKDEILYKAFVSRPARPLSDAASEALPAFLRPWQFPEWLGPTLYWAAVAAATMTAFYMSRLFILTFLGDFRGWVVGRASSHGGASVAAHGAAEAGHDSHDSHEHHDDLTQPGPPPPESPWQMTIPLIVLGTASVVAGVLNAGLFHFEPLGHWLDPVFAEAVNNGVKERENAASLLWPLAAPGFLAFCVGSATAYWMYVMKRGEPAKQLADAQPALYRLVLDKWRIDELYQATVISAIDALADTAVAFDKYVVDGVLAKATAGAVAASGAVLRRLQSGVIHVYGAVMAAGIAGLAFFFGVPQPSMNVTEKDGDFVVTAGPGLSYSYRWDADGNGQVDEAEFGASRSVKLHLEPDAKQTVRVEVKNAFGVVASKEVEVHRPKPKEKDEPKPIKIGQR